MENRHLKKKSFILTNLSEKYLNDDPFMEQLSYNSIVNREKLNVICSKIQRKILLAA